MHDFHQISLRRHNCIDRLVRRWRLIDHVCVLATFHSFSHADVVLDREALFGFMARHGTTCTVTAAVEAFRVTLAAHDVRSRTHAARDNAHVSLARTNRTLSRDEYVLTEVRLTCHIIVVTVNALYFRSKRRQKSATAHRAHDLSHHQI